jgi:hypothetical protein
MAANDGHNINKRAAKMNSYLTTNQENEAA